MPLLATLTLTLTGLYAGLTALRLGLALRYLARPTTLGLPLAAPAAPPLPVAGVTVLQAILSGDPLLEDTLRRNLRHHPEAAFVWLLDEDDHAGRQMAARLLAAAPAARVRVQLTPPVPQGINPKLFKLQLALPAAGPVVAVLDDDTVLPPGALAQVCAVLAATDGLATGLPYYGPEAGGWARLVTAFVNANSLLTYLPPLFFQSPVTINGMFYATRTATLRQLGGFAAVAGELCDDFALAALFRRHGRPVLQTTIRHALATTVPDLGTYLHLMRRWMVFARRLLLAAFSWPVALLVVLPGALPPALLGLALASGRPALLAAGAGTLLLKATALALVRRRYLGTPEGPRTVLLEVLADLLQPLHLLHALAQPRRVRWRNKSIELRAGGLHYV